MQEEEYEPVERKAKTHKGRKILAEREAKLEEGPRKTLFLKSTKTSEAISKISHELYIMKKHNSLTVNKRYDIRPFDKTSEIEFLTKKYDCPLFVLASNSKKRPDNLTIGRVYENQILDMVEFGIQDFKSKDEFLHKISIPLNARPCVSFHGDLFEFDANYIRMKNLLLDLFVENIEISKFNILNFSHLVSITLEKEGELFLKVYSISNVNEGSNNEKFNLEEIGPSCKILVRRHQFANDDLYKQACKQPKIDKSKNKNMKTNAMGDKKGRLYVERQNLDAIALKKRKKLKTEKPGKAKKEFAQQEKELNEEIE